MKQHHPCPNNPPRCRLQDDTNLLLLIVYVAKLPNSLQPPVPAQPPTPTHPARPTPPTCLVILQHDSRGGAAAHHPPTHPRTQPVLFAHSPALVKPQRATRRRCCGVSLIGSAFMLLSRCSRSCPALTRPTTCVGALEGGGGSSSGCEPGRPWAGQERRRVLLDGVHARGTKPQRLPASQPSS